jgi:pilus assembly protein CpaE
MTVDDSALVRRVVAQIIQVQPDMELVGEADNGRDGARLATELQPDIVLMDIHMPDLDGIEATRLLANRLPNGAIITVTAEERPELRAQAQVAGAKGYVLKPLGEGEELLATIREVYSQLQEAQLVHDTESAEPPGGARGRGHCIAVMGAKGGVGKTTIAIGVALALHQQHKQSVALFDADLLFGDLNVQLDLTGERSVVDLVPHTAALEPYVVSQAIRHHVSGLDVLAGAPRPEQADIVGPDDIRAVLGVLLNMYDFVVVDTALSYDERTLAILDAADVYLMVIAPHLGALQNASHFLDLAKVLGYPTDRMCFVLNRANALAGLKLDLIGDVIGRHRILQVPSGGAAVSEAINRGQPLILSHPQLPFSRAIVSIAEHVRSLVAVGADR